MMKKTTLWTVVGLFLNASLLYSNGAAKVYVVQGGGNSVAFINADTLQVAGTVGVGTIPQGIARAGTGMYVTNSYSDNVNVIDINTNQVSGTIAVGVLPAGLALAGTGMYVANFQFGTVNIIDVTNNQVAGTVTVGGSFPQAVALGGTGMYIANVGSDTVSVIDITNNQVSGTIAVGAFPSALALAGTGMYVANNGSNNVNVIDITTNQVSGTIAGGTNPRGLALAGTGMYVTNYGSNNVNIIDITTQQVSGTVAVGNGPGAILLVGDEMYVALAPDNNISIIDINTQQVVGTIAVQSPGAMALGGFFPSPTPITPPVTPPDTSLSVGRTAVLSALFNGLAVIRDISAHLSSIDYRIGEFRDALGSLGDRSSSRRFLMVDASDRIRMPTTYAGCSVPTYSTWVQAIAEYAHLSSVHSQPGFGFIAEAAQGGFDYSIDGHNLIGGSLCYSHIHGHLEENTGHTNTDSYLGSVYAIGTAGAWHFLPVLMGGFNDTHYLRRLLPASRSRATLMAWQLVPHLEIEYEHEMSWGSVAPFVASDWAISWQRGYKERGDSSQKVSQKAHTSSLVRAEAGIHLCEEWKGMRWGSFFLREKLAYVFEQTFGFGKDPYTLVGLPDTFTAASSNLILNLGLIRVDATVAFGTCKPVLLSLGCEGEAGSKYWASQATLELSKRF